MDFDALVAEIANRVAEHMASTTAVPAASTAGCSCPVGGDSKKPKLLVLTQDHGDVCHTVLESKRLAEKYTVQCALTNNYDCDAAEYDGIVLFDLTNEAMARIATGICGTPYTNLVSHALLLGKKVWVPKNEVEILDYAETAAAPYFNMMRQHLTLLEQSGVTICSADELEDVILGNATPCAPVTPAPAAVPAPAPAAASTPAPVPAAAPAAAPAPLDTEYFTPTVKAPDVVKPVKEFTIEKRVITERDINEAHTAGATIVHVGPRAILTDLARDYAHERHIQLVKG